jgi:hypothetical protein
MRVHDDNEVRLMFHRALTGEPTARVRLEKMVGQILGAGNRSSAATV